MIYKAIIHKEIIIHTNTEEDARDIAIERFDLDSDEIEIVCVGEE